LLLEAMVFFDEAFALLVEKTRVKQLSVCLHAILRGVSREIVGEGLRDNVRGKGWHSSQT
jgi:hypothetical protein